MEETRNEVVETNTFDDGVEVYDLNPISEESYEETGSNGLAYAIVGAGIAAAVGGAIVGVKKLKAKYDDKKLEKAKKLLEDNDYEVTKYEVSESEKVEVNTADVPETPDEENPKKKK